MVGLNGAGKSTLLRLLTAHRGAGHRPGHPPAGPAVPRPAADPRPRRRPRPSATWWSATPGCRRRSPPSTSGPATPASATVLSGLGMPGPRAGRAGRADVRRRAAPGRAGRAAGPRVRPAGPRRADQPPRHRRHHLARRSTCCGRRGALVVVTHDRWFLDAVCDQTWEVADQTVRAYEGGYAAWILARAERERVAAAAEARRQNLLRKEIAWLRRGPPARTSQAEVPHRRGQRADRRRARAARHGVAAAAGHRPARQAGVRAGRRRRSGSATGTLLRDVNWLVGPGRPDRHRRRQRGRQVDPAAGAGRRPAGGRRPADHRLDGADRRSCPRSWPSCPAHLRVLEAVEEVARRVNLGGRELTAGQLAEVFGFTDRRLWTPVGRPVRRRAAPAADAAAAGRRAQRAAARRADQRPGHRHPGLAGGSARHLAGHDDHRRRTTGTWSSGSATPSYALYGDGRLTHLPGGVDEYLARSHRRRTVPADADAGPAPAVRRRRPDRRGRAACSRAAELRAAPQGADPAGASGRQARAAGGRAARAARHARHRLREGLRPRRRAARGHTPSWPGPRRRGSRWPSGSATSDRSTCAGRSAARRIHNRGAARRSAKGTPCRTSRSTTTCGRCTGCSPRWRGSTWSSSAWSGVGADLRRRPLRPAADVTALGLRHQPGLLDRSRSSPARVILLAVVRRAQRRPLRQPLGRHRASWWSAWPMLALLHTDLNVLNFSIATVIVSFVIGMVLFSAGPVRPVRLGRRRPRPRRPSATAH